MLCRYFTDDVHFFIFVTNFQTKRTSVESHVQTTCRFQQNFGTSQCSVTFGVRQCRLYQTFRIEKHVCTAVISQPVYSTADPESLARFAIAFPRTLDPTYFQNEILVFE